MVAGLALTAARSAFQALKDRFTRAPLLRHFDFSRKRVIQVDSLAYAWSAIMSQPDDAGVLLPVCYFSQKLTDAEHQWEIHDQELGAIISCFKEWRDWLVGAAEPIVVLSDHANLQYFMTNQTLSARQARRAAFLLAYHFSILHTPGKSNPADPASRRPDYVSAVKGPSSLVLF